jgi:hypothetical protein
MTLNGTLEISDVQQDFDKLQSWEKKQFIAQNIEHFGVFDTSDLINSFNIDTWNLLQYFSTEDICEYFNYNELLNEIGQHEIIQYLIHWNKLLNEDIKEIIEDKIKYGSKTSLIKLETILGEIIEKLHKENIKQS